MLLSIAMGKSKPVKANIMRESFSNYLASDQKNANSRIGDGIMPLISEKEALINVFRKQLKHRVSVMQQESNEDAISFTSSQL